MELTYKQLEEILNVSAKIIAVYLQRYEFKHIKRKRGKKTKKFGGAPMLFENVTDCDIERLKKLVTRKYKDRKENEYN